MPIRITIDSDRCQGHAQCWTYAPDLFALDELGFAHPLNDEVPDDEAQRIDHAVAGCPERAISAEKA